MSTTDTAGYYAADLRYILANEMLEKNCSKRDHNSDGRVVDVPAFWLGFNFKPQAGQINTSCHQLAADATFHC